MVKGKNRSCIFRRPICFAYDERRRGARHYLKVCSSSEGLHVSNSDVFHSSPHQMSPTTAGSELSKVMPLSLTRAQAQKRVDTQITTGAAPSAEDSTCATVRVGTSPSRGRQAKQSQQITWRLRVGHPRRRGEFSPRWGFTWRKTEIPLRLIDLSQTPSGRFFVGKPVLAHACTKCNMRKPMTLNASEK